MNENTVLIVEDEAITAMDIQSRLKKLGYLSTDIITSGEEAILAAEKLRPHLVLMDIVLKGKIDGTVAAQHISKHLNIPIVFLTAYNDDDTFKRAKLSDPYGYLTKPFETRDLRNAIELALYKHDKDKRTTASEYRYRAVMENASCGIFIFNQSGIILDLNKKTEIIFGQPRDQVIGKDFKTFVVSMERSYADLQIEKLLIEKSIGPNLGHFQQANGEVRDVEYSAVYIDNLEEKFIFCILNDITERNKLRAQTMLSDKLATIGSMATGIIHEINNPMSWILTNLSYLRDKINMLKTENLRQTDIIPKLEEVIGESIQGADRINDIIHELKGFARDDQDDIALLDVHDAIQSAIHMAQPQYKNITSIDMDFADNIPLIMLTHSKLQQVILNLIMNAVQSMDIVNFKKNSIQIQTRFIMNSVHIDIADTGKGISKNYMKKIFEPFFTTKPVGIGTGIGLSICYDIIKNFGGEITVESVEGVGTTFHITLPIQIRVSNQKDILSPKIKPLVRKRILVVDDEPIILAKMDRILSSYHDVSTCDSRTAVDFLITQQMPFDIIITDLCMPDVSGVDLYRSANKVNADIGKKFIFMTGYPLGSPETELLKNIKNICLEKPFTTDQLFQAIDNIIT